MKAKDAPMKWKDVPAKGNDTPMNQQDAPLKRKHAPLKRKDAPIKRQDASWLGLESPLRRGEPSDCGACRPMRPTLGRWCARHYLTPSISGFHKRECLSVSP